MKKEIPRHIAFIMDGNGRWAKRKLLPRNYGHKKGLEKLKLAIKIAEEIKIPYVTFYAFSVENFKRPKKEINDLFNYFNDFLQNYEKDYKNKNYKINICGDIESDLLSQDLKNNIKKVMEYTKNNTGLCVNIAFNYGGRDEIVYAVNQILKNGEHKKITKERISQHLYFKDIPDPEIIVRTAGEQRLSNFLTWESIYSEFIFLEECWPDFTKDSFNRILIEYNKRERKLGGLSDGKKK